MRPILSECFEGNAGRKKSHKRCTQMKLVQEAHAVTTKTREEMKGCIIDYLYHHAPVACNVQQRPQCQIQPRDACYTFTPRPQKRRMGQSQGGQGDGQADLSSHAVW